MQPRLAMTVTTLFVAFALLIGPGAAVAASSPGSQTLQLGLTGGLVNVDTQHYSSSGSNLTTASITLPGGISVPVSSSARFNYQINAQVQGMKVAGFATFHYSDGNHQSGPVDITARAVLGDMIPAFCLPSFSSPCLSTDTSEVAAFYIGIANVTLAIGSSAPTTIPNYPVLFESAYMNPFGNTLFVGTADGALSFGVQYHMATSQWSGLTTAGSAVGPAGIKGAYSQNASINENLYSGNETDTGAISLSSFTGRYATLNSAGTFSGKSDIPLTGSYDCTDLLQYALSDAGVSVTLPANSCLATGMHSTGQFNLRSTTGNSFITGSYNLVWNVPAVGFQGTVTATINTH